MDQPPDQRLPSSAPPAPPAWGPAESYVLGLVAMLAVLLLPVWAWAGTEYVPDFLGQMLTPWLLPALGMLWAVRCRGVDLSVWVGFYIGWAVAAAIVAAGGHWLVALAGVVASGLALGGLNAVGAAWAGLPSWGITGVTAILGVSVVRGLLAGVRLEPSAWVLRNWPGVLGSVWMTGLLYVAALLAGLLVLRRRGPLRPGRAGLAVALVGSGVLSAVGGLCALAKWGQVPQGVGPVGDLRVLAAVAVSGAVVLRGPWRGLLAALLLPLGMLLATVWRQRVWDVPSSLVPINLLVLTAMVLAAQWAAAALLSSAAGGGGRRASAAAACGIALLAVTASRLPGGVSAALHYAGALVWAVGVGAALVEWTSRRRGRSRPADWQQPANAAPPQAGRDSRERL